MIPVIDLFAGPGGLGEGFGALRNDSDDAVFDIQASFEKEPVAHRTLSLRAFYRAFGHPSDVPGDYYAYLRGKISREALFDNPRFNLQKQQALGEAHCIELGESNADAIDEIIKAKIKPDEPWVLIGGPPCQVYSVVGRSRWRRENVERFENDHRHFLYKEYLRIIKKFRPAVFVMENVRGVLSSTHGGSPIFQRILDDLAHPAEGLRYEIRSLNFPKDVKIAESINFVVQSESHGLPQARHRVMLLGVREDISDREHMPLVRQGQVSVRDAISDLPQIRSVLSKEKDSPEAWKCIFKELLSMLERTERGRCQFVPEMMNESLAGGVFPISTGGRYIQGCVKAIDSIPSGLAKWFHDERLSGYCQHEARGHMRTDLYRYLYAACHAKKYGFSPKVDEFPICLLPEHENIYEDKVPFRDRFRVQTANSPSTTVVSHISKDGHYYIHYDPVQCRSLTVREAARLQTFPDNYFFEGSRTEQYWQVGNAVPPFLAHQVAVIVAGVVQNSSQKSAVDSGSEAFRHSELVV